MPSIEQLPNKKWKATIRLPIILPSGQKKRASRTHRLKTVVEDWAKIQEAKILSGGWSDPSAGRRTLAEFTEIWQLGQVVEYNTARNRKYQLNRVLARWGTTRLVDIEYMRVREWVSEMQQAETGPHAIAGALQLLGAILDDAMLAKAIPSNPCRGVKPPAWAKHEDRIVELDEEDAILRAIPSDRDRAFIQVLLDTGMRWEEAAGLHRNRVNLLRRRIQVVHVLLRDGTIKEYPKGRKQRPLPLPKRTYRALSRILESNNGGGRCRNNHCKSTGPSLVFGSPQGSWMNYENFRVRVWQPAVEAARICGFAPDQCAEEHNDVSHRIPEPWPTLHDLRHTYGTRLANAGVPPHEIRDLLGHTSLRATDRYLHSGEERFDRATAALERDDDSSVTPAPEIRQSRAFGDR